MNTRPENTAALEELADVVGLAARCTRPGWRAPDRVVVRLEWFDVPTRRAWSDRLTRAARRCGDEARALTVTLGCALALALGAALVLPLPTGLAGPLTAALALAVLLACVTVRVQRWRLARELERLARQFCAERTHLEPILTSSPRRLSLARTLPYVPAL